MSMMTKREFEEEKMQWDRAKKERLEFITNSFSKSIKLRPYKQGSYFNGFIRTAIVSVPSGITSMLCGDDLAMLVAGGTKYASYRVLKKSDSNVISTEVSVGQPVELLVTVVLDIKDAVLPASVV